MAWEDDAVGDDRPILEMNGDGSIRKSYNRDAAECNPQKNFCSTRGAKGDGER